MILYPRPSACKHNAGGVPSELLQTSSCTPPPLSLTQATSMLALGSCVMAMQMAQAYPSSTGRSSAVRVPPPSYMESPSEDYQTPQTSGRPLPLPPARRTWPSARKMGSKMRQKLHQHEEHEPEPEPPGTKDLVLCEELQDLLSVLDAADARRDGQAQGLPCGGGAAGGGYQQHR